ncbi:retrovirus-related pol polyprotein from transposon TNT 1-94 [Tanacetum coccineum]|uniref:Retrovirus-related pol polyprotein from transposon TNT 1-94 n=1 Tax=Tanacetum coccineum TaxID=301880 RepID=A0ABQ5CSS4_9ASTR
MLNIRIRPLEFEVGDKVMLKVAPWKGVMRFGKRGKLNPCYIRPFQIIESIGPVAYRLELPQELSRVHNVFHVCNLKKCLSDDTLIIPLEEIQLDDKLNFVEEPVEIMGCEGDDGEGLYVRGRTNRRDSRQSNGKSRPKSQSGRLKCYISQSKDHLKRNCPKNNRKKSTGYVKKDEQPSSSGSTYDDSEVMMVMSVQALLDWIMDSGCSYHMTPRYNPELKRNLISLETLKKEGFTVKLQSGKVKVINGSRVVLSGIRMDNCVYSLDGHAMAGELNASVEEKDSLARVWVYILRFKHEAFGKFKEWKHLVENQTGRTIKKLRTDNGLEFCNREFEQLCIESGIARHLTVVGTPQQNEVAERMNRTLMDKDGSILFGLPGSPQQKFLVLRFFDVKEQQGIDRLNIEKLDGNIVQKHGGSKQVGFKQLGPGVETGVHGVHDEKRVWFEVELQGAQGDREAEVFQVSNDDTAVAQRRLEDKQPEEKTNTDYLSGLSKILWAEDTTISTYLVNRNMGFNESGEYKKTFIGSGVGTGSIQVLQGDEFEVEPQDGHTFEVEPHGNVDHVVGSQEVQTQDLIYYHPALACEVISKWKARLKDDMDARSDVYVLSNGCKKCSDDSDGYYWESTPDVGPRISYNRYQSQVGPSGGMDGVPSVRPPVRGRKGRRYEKGGIVAIVEGEAHGALGLRGGLLGVQTQSHIGRRYEKGGIVAIVEGEAHGALGLRGGLLGVQTQSHIGKIIISKLTYKLGGLLLLSPIGFRMEPQLGLYVRLGEMLGLRFPTHYSRFSKLSLISRNTDHKVVFKYLF